jgi:hypothetical protein
MIIAQEITEPCRYCGVSIVIREYKGLEGHWYTEHVCEEVSHEIEIPKNCSRG